MRSKRFGKTCGNYPKNSKKPILENLKTPIAVWLTSCFLKDDFWRLNRCWNCQKIQELGDFTRNARAGGDTNGIALANIETEILKKYNSLIAFGQTVYDCEQTKCPQLSQLRDQLDALTEKFTQEASAFRKTVRDRLPSNKQETRVLAMGVPKAFPGFNALENVPVELASIVGQQGRDRQGIYPGLEFLNEAFNFRALRDNLAGNKVLHIATHGKFESGRPEDSYLFLGTGERFTVEQIQKLQNYMGDIHLVVLSACETALPDQNGIEMSGISYYFLSNGAKAVMASLWLVNDGSTSLLMQQFYKNLAAGTMTKVEALQQVQMSLLQGKATDKDAPPRSDGDVALEPKPGEPLPRSRASDFFHPYYWAPFILIGNSL